MTDLTGIAEFREFTRQLWKYISKHIYRAFFRFESGKDLVTGVLYRKRGKYAQPLLHSAMLALIFFGITFGPRLVLSSFAEETELQSQGTGGSVLSSSLDSTGLVTLESDKPPSDVREYEVRDGDTLSSIALKFDVSIDTIKWANETIDWKKIKPGTKVKVPPVTGIVYKVKPGDTIYTIAKKFETNAQGIVDFIYEEFKGTGNMELVLDRRLSERRIFPAIDVYKSGTRREDLLFSGSEYQNVVVMRRMLDMLNDDERTSVMVDRLGKAKSNKEFLAALKEG